MLKEFRADLHIHTLLSGCAELEMLPGLIVMQAMAVGLDVIAICDHNSCENAGSVIEASCSTSVKVLPGIEVQSVEGIHIICIFEETTSALKMQDEVYSALPEIELPEARINEQLVVDSSDELVGLCSRPIGVPTSLGLDDIYNKARKLGAVVIPAHIDRHGTGLMDVLGYLPEGSDYDAYELSGNIDETAARTTYPELLEKSLIKNSDAHWLSAIGERQTILRMEHRTLGELRMALRKMNGRSSQVA